MLASVAEKVSLNLVCSDFRKVCKGHTGRLHKLAVLITFLEGHCLVGIKMQTDQCTLDFLCKRVVVSGAIRLQTCSNYNT